MKKTSILAATLIAASTMTATAGGLSEPVMEPVVIVEEVEAASGDTSGILQWLILAAVIVAASAQ